jgi:putative addiction module component (TIGR02574 family)
MAPKVLAEPEGFRNLSKEEQIRYLQDLWDEVSDPPEEIPIPESHLELVEKRLEGYRSDPSKARPAYEALDRLAKKGR